MKFIDTVENLLEEMNWAYKNLSIISSLSELMQDDPAKALSTVNKLIKKAPNPLPLGLIAARRFSAVGLLAEAEKLLTKLSEIDETSVVVMNEMAKIYLRKKRYKNASDMLRRAHKNSPMNMQRICLMGEAELNLRDPEAAREYFKTALEIDSENAIAQSGVIVSKNMSDMLTSPEPLELSLSFASVLNSIGIGMVRKGEFKEGIQQYHSAMPFLHTNVDSARLAFNLGLGYLRWGKPGSALPWFEKSEKIGGIDFKRSQGFVKKLKDSKNDTVQPTIVEKIDNDPSFGVENEFEENEVVGGVEEVESANNLVMAPLGDGGEGSTVSDDEDVSGDEDFGEDDFGEDDLGVSAKEASGKTTAEDDGEWDDFDIGDGEIVA